MKQKQKRKHTTENNKPPNNKTTTTAKQTSHFDGELRKGDRNRIELSGNQASQRAETEEEKNKNNNNITNENIGAEQTKRCTRNEIVLILSKVICR